MGLGTPVLLALLVSVQLRPCAPAAGSSSGRSARRDRREVREIGKRLERVSDAYKLAKDYMDDDDFALFDGEDPDEADDDFALFDGEDPDEADDAPSSGGEAPPAPLHSRKKRSRSSKSRRRKTAPTKSWSERHPEETKIAMEHHNTAVEAEEQGNATLAEFHYRQAAEIAPVWDSPQLNLAVLLARTRRPDEAIVQYGKMLKQFPNQTEVLYNLANVYYHKRELEKAKELFERTLGQAWADAKNNGKEDSKILAATATNLGNVLQQLGDYEGAVGQVRNMSRPNMLYVLSLDKWPRTKTHCAFTQHRLPMAISPETPDAPFNLGVSLIALGGASAKEVHTLWTEAAVHIPHFAFRLVNAGGWAVDALKIEQDAVALAATPEASKETGGPAGSA